MTLFNVLQQTNLPCAYAVFDAGDAPAEPPYIVYIGRGQNTFDADNTYYHARNTYQIEYYFNQKDEAAEALIESLLLSNGYMYEKSGDVYIESEGVFVIYYYV